MRYLIIQSVCQAPSTGGGKYRRPVVLYVVDTQSGPTKWHWVRTGVVRSWSNIDSRYSGPRSEYGQSNAAAIELRDRLNAQELSLAAA